MKIRIYIASYGSNAGPLFNLIALPSGDPIASYQSMWTGFRDYNGVTDGTTQVRIEHVNYAGGPGLCGPTILDVTPLDATTTTTTTGGATPPTTSTTTTGTTSSTSSTTTTTTTSGPIPPTSTSTTTSSSSTSTTTTTVESCSIIGNMTCGGGSSITTTTTILDCDIQGNMIYNLMN